MYTGRMVLVSVPSRGLSYLNKEDPYYFSEEDIVSVPSRGLSYLNGNVDYNAQRLARVSVPSRGLSYLNLTRQMQEKTKQM